MITFIDDAALGQNTPEKRNLFVAASKLLRSFPVHDKPHVLIIRWEWMGLSAATKESKITGFLIPQELYNGDEVRLEESFYRRISYSNLIIQLNQYNTAIGDNSVHLIKDFHGSNNTNYLFLQNDEFNESDVLSHVEYENYLDQKKRWKAFIDKTADKPLIY